MQPIKATSADFDSLVLSADRPVIVDFWAEWCPPCRVLGPMLDRAAAALGDEVRIVKVDADQSPELLAKYGVSSIPTLILFREGAEIERRVGPEGLAPLVSRARAFSAAG